MKQLTRSKLAKSSGIGIEAIRFYEQKGLISKPTRTSAGYRQYKEEDAKQIRFIKRAQELGFTLKEIKELIELEATSKTTCGDVKKRADLKTEEIKQKIKDLKKMIRSLDEISSCCARGKTTCGVCSILDCFEGKC